MFGNIKPQKGETMVNKIKSRVGKALWGVYAPQAIDDRVRAYMKAEKRTLTYVVVEGVSEFLAKRGF